MKYLWDEINSIKKNWGSFDKIVLLADFDGTLIPITKRLEKVTLPVKVKNLLTSIRDHPRLYLGLISGRKLSNLKLKVGIDNIIYVGSHGWEWEIDKKRYYFKPSLKRLKALDSLKAKLKKLSADFAGTFMENKYCSFTVNYRFTENQAIFQQSFSKIIKKENQQGLIKIMKGKKVYDFHPNEDWDKGHAVSQIINHLKKTSKKDNLLLFYIGDDTTDEDVFDRHSKITTIRVGKNRFSKAKYFVKNPNQIHNFLKIILGWAEGI